MPTFNYTLGFSDTDSGIARTESQIVQVQQLGFHNVYRMDVSTSEVTHSILAEIGNASYIWMMNRDATNFIDVGFISTGVYEVRLLAGQHALFPLLPTTATLYLKADTAAADLQFYIREA
ncbi:MAG: hypothetical protein OEN49_06890 [Gammaproteobacteria bacterium]|nr:hypothetical protein [Gammaproteobacteria bacterium]